MTDCYIDPDECDFPYTYCDYGSGISVSFRVESLWCDEPDDYGRTVYHRLVLSDARPFYFVKEMVADVMPHQHCQHSYDCCGRLYSNGGNLVGPLDSYRPFYEPHDVWLVSEGYTRNI